MTYLYPYRRGTGWRSQGFRSRPNQGANGSGGHTGFDQAMTAGQPLYAPGDGIIRNSGWLSDNYRDNGWWLTRMGGDTLVIDMVDAFRRSSSLPTFIFAHCSDTMAQVGQFVRKGDLVARSGNTGTATTGAHVHIEALPPAWNFNNGVYGRVDPELYFDEWIDDYTQSGLAAMGGATTTTEENPLAEFTFDDLKRAAYEGGIQAHNYPFPNELGGHTSVAGMLSVFDKQRLEIISQTAEATARLFFTTKFARQGAGQSGETDVASVVSWSDANFTHAGSGNVAAGSGLNQEQINTAIKAGLDAALEGVQATVTLGKVGE